MSAFLSTATPSFDIDTVPDHHRDMVLTLIPDARIADGYVHRDALPGVYDFDMLDAAMKAQENVLLTGPTGSAKTTLFRAYAAARQLPLAIVECSANMDPKTVIGRRDIDALTGRPIWLDSPHTLVLRYGGVLVYDEANLAHQRVTAAWHGVTSVMRRLDLQENGEIIRAGYGGLGEPQPVLIGVAINPTTYNGTTRLNQAFRNRFGIPAKWPYLREVEEQLVDSTTLLDMAEMIRNLADVQSPLSTNMLIEFERHVHMFGIAAAAVLFCNHFDDDEVGPVQRAMEANSAIIEAEVLANVEPDEFDIDEAIAADLADYDAANKEAGL